MKYSKYVAIYNKDTFKLIDIIKVTDRMWTTVSVEVFEEACRKSYGNNVTSDYYFKYRRNRGMST